MSEPVRILPAPEQGRDASIASDFTVGTVVSIVGEEVLVNFPGNPNGPVPARLTSLARTQLRTLSPPASVLLFFQAGDPTAPIIVDTIIDPSPPDAEIIVSESPDAESTAPAGVFVDGKPLAVDAAEEVVLRCGKASITLNKSGKVLIKGEYVISRASGTHCIQGGTIRIN